MTAGATFSVSWSIRLSGSCADGAAVVRSRNSTKTMARAAEGLMMRQESGTARRALQVMGDGLYTTPVIRPVALAAATLIAVSASPPAQSPADQPAARLLIDAVATDNHGMPIMDLKPADLEVWIGHFRVPIETLTAVTPGTDEQKGRLLVLLMDDVTLPVEFVPRAREVARHFVTRMAPGDRMAVVMLNGG